jgi:hypothetical protein
MKINFDQTRARVCVCERERGVKKNARTDDGFPIFLDFERTFAISDQEREVKQVLDRLRKIVRVDDESEKVHGTILFHEQVSNLKTRQRRRHRQRHRHIYENN